MDATHDAGPTTRSTAGQFVVLPQRFDVNNAANFDSYNNNSCATAERTTHWFVNWTYPTAQGPYVRVPAQVFRSCMRVTFTADMEFVPCISSDGGCGVYPSCLTNPNKLEVEIKNAAQVTFRSSVSTIVTVFANPLSWSGETCYFERTNVPGSTCDQREALNCNVALPVTMQTVPGGWLCTQVPLRFNGHYTVDIDLAGAEAPGGCSPADWWEIHSIEIGSTTISGDGLFYRFLRPGGVPDVSQLEGIFSTETVTVSDVKWECQGW